MKFSRLSARQCRALSESQLFEIEPPGFTCPECGGVVMRIQDGKEVQYRCQVGHVFSSDSFSEAHADALERALWVALRKLNEQRCIQENLARTGGRDLRKRHHENADAARHDMQLLHKILLRL